MKTKLILSVALAFMMALMLSLPAFAAGRKNTPQVTWDSSLMMYESNDIVSVTVFDVSWEYIHPSLIQLKMLDQTNTNLEYIQDIYPPEGRAGIEEYPQNFIFAANNIPFSTFNANDQIKLYITVFQGKQEYNTNSTTVSWFPY